MKEQVQSYKNAWASETREKIVPAACQEGMNRFFTARTEFIRVEGEIISLVQAMDSTETMKKFLPLLNELSQDERR